MFFNWLRHHSHHSISTVIKRSLIWLWHHPSYYISKTVAASHIHITANDLLRIYLVNCSFNLQNVFQIINLAHDKQSISSHWLNISRHVTRTMCICQELNRLLNHRPGKSWQISANLISHNWNFHTF